MTDCYDMALDSLRQACLALYGSDAEQRRAADAYLKAARSRDGFWVLALQLLTAPGASAQEQFFSAHAVRMAAQRARDLVAPEAGQGLAGELARLTVEAVTGQQWAIANQLAGALAQLAVRAPWWGVGSLVADALSLLGAASLCHYDEQQQQEDPGRLHAVLLVLAALPETCQSKDVSLHPERRAAAAAALSSEPAVSQLAESGLGQHAAPACQLAALQLVQAWSTLPGAAVALAQLSSGTVAGLHQAVLASPAVTTHAAETVAALYGACAAPAAHPASQALLRQLLPHLHDTVSGAMQAAAAQQRQHAQHAAQLLNAAITILSASGAALLAQLHTAAGEEEGEGATSSSISSEDPRPEPQAGSQQGCPDFWEGLAFVAGSLLELLQHPGLEIALASVQPWDDSLLPGLEQLLLGGRSQHGTQQAQQLLERLCGGIIQRICLPEDMCSSCATADARDLPSGIRTVRKELAETFRAAVSILGTEKAVQHLLELAVAYTAWRVGSPAHDWRHLECVIYALNLVLPRHLAQQAQQGGAAAERAQHAAAQALGVCLAALNSAVPKLAGSALTLLGGLPDALAGLPWEPVAAAPSYAAQNSDSGLLAQLLLALLGLLESPDPKLSRNAATAIHRLVSNARLAAALAVQHADWASRLAGLYCRRGGLQQPPTGGEDLCTEEFLLRALCHLARASAQQAQHGKAPAGQAAGLQGLALQLIRQSAAQAGAALSQLQREAVGAPWGQAGVLPPTAAVVAAVKQCGAQLEVIAVVMDIAGLQGAPQGLEQALGEVWGVVQQALQLLTPQQEHHHQEQQQPGQHVGHMQQPHAVPLLLGSCRVVGAAATAAPQPSMLRLALSLLQPLLEDPAHPCLLGTLQAIVGGAAAAMAGAAGAGSCPGSQGPACGTCSTCSEFGIAGQRHLEEVLLPGLVIALVTALQGSLRRADDSEWAAPVLRMGAAAAQQLPQLLAGPLLQQLLDVAKQGARSYQREVCEATLALAVALCCSPAAAAGETPSGCHGGPGGSCSMGSQLVLWLLLGASSSMPPYMVMPIAEALHTIWAAVGTDRFGSWLAHAVLQLAPADAPWRAWKQETVHAAVEELLGCQEDGKRFKRQLKVLCGGKKKGRHMDVPARGQ